METTHVHLFMIPMIYFVLCYLFEQTGLRSNWKALLIGITYANIAGFLIAPYLIRYLSPALAVIMSAHGLLLIMTAFLLAYYTLREQFRNHRTQNE